MRAIPRTPALICVLLALLGSPTAEGVRSPQSSTVAALPQGRSVVLDHVVAAINGAIILQSDIEEEMRFLVFQSSNDAQQNTPQHALQRLINRDLILQQMKTGFAMPPPTAEQAQKQISELRKQLPECVSYHCETEAGWQNFLRAHSLTETEVRDYWRQRMLILDFIRARFGAGVRIPPSEIQQYYRDDFVPQFAKRGIEPPALAAVSARIEAILLQQQVNVILDQWLQSLKSEGSVNILDPAYGQVGTTGSGDNAQSQGQP